MLVNFLLSALASLALVSPANSKIQLAFDFLPEDVRMMTLELPDGYSFAPGTITTGKDGTSVVRGRKAAISADGRKLTVPGKMLAWLSAGVVAPKVVAYSYGSSYAVPVGLNPDEVPPAYSDEAPAAEAIGPIMLGIELTGNDTYGVGNIPLNRGLGQGECLSITFSDAAGRMFDSRFRMDYSICSMGDSVPGTPGAANGPSTGVETKPSGGAELFSGEDYLSLWVYPRKPVELPRDTTRFYVNAAGQKMTAGRSMAFQFGSTSWGFHDSHTDFRQTHYDFLSAVPIYAANGLDHIRIPIDEGWCFFSNGEAKPDFKEKVIKLVDAVIASGMRVIIDYHWMASGLIIMPSSTNRYEAYPSEQEIRFRYVWKQLHEMFKDYPPEQLAYEIINEADMGPGYDWNTFIERAVYMMRCWGGNEVRRFVVCPCRQTYWAYLEEFRVPKGDPNLIATFHDYTPDPLTFYRNGHYRYRGPIHYPGRLITDEELSMLSEKEYENSEPFRDQTWDKEELYRHFGDSYWNTRGLGVPVWIGEYGAEVGAPYQDRLNYYRDACEVFRHYGFSYAFWYEISTKPREITTAPDAEILKAITGR